jgi:hypothetical protein
LHDRIEFDDALVPRRPTKVFGVGLHKTSTSSLANALYILGYHVGGTFATSDHADQAALEEYVLSAAAMYDAVQDMPWPAFYRLLDQHFPGSKFVLTIRDPHRWVSSVVTHFGRKDISSHEYFYGVPTAAGNEAVYLERFERHNREIRDYFVDRPDDLLVMDIGAGHGWEELCAFLDVPVPDMPFPHQNPASGRRTGRYRRRLRREFENRAVQLGVPRERLAPDRIRAEAVYAAMHRLCRRFDALVALIGRIEDDERRFRSEGLLRAWLQRQLAWAVDVGAIDEADEVRSALRSWDLDRAWARLGLATRCWAGELTDDGFGVQDALGRPARDDVRRCVNVALECYDSIVSAIDTDSVLRRPDDGLHML